MGSIYAMKMIDRRAFSLGDQCSITTCPFLEFWKGKNQSMTEEISNVRSAIPERT